MSLPWMWVCCGMWLFEYVNSSCKIGLSVSMWICHNDMMWSLTKENEYRGVGFCYKFDIGLCQYRGPAIASACWMKLD